MAVMEDPRMKPVELQLTDTGLLYYGRKPRNVFEKHAAEIQARQPVTDRVYKNPEEEATDKETRRSEAGKRAAATRQDKQRRAAVRMCLRAGMMPTQKLLDYRYWQCKKCGLDPESERIWLWWSALHWQCRDELVDLSRSARWH